MPPHGYKCNPSPAGIARRAAARRRKLDALVADMFAAYSTGISIAEVGRRFGGRSNTAVRNLFQARGYPFRAAWRSHSPHAPNRCFVAKAILTDAEVDAVLEQATRFAIPDALKFTWRKWTLEQRGTFLARLRARLGCCRAQVNRPTGPYSANVEFFDYASPRAHAIAAALNVGRDSRTKVAQIRLTSEGVIFEDALWFWTYQAGYAHGPVRAGALKLLHHHIWSRANGGRAVPSTHILRFIDGNENNLVLENLRLVTRDEVLRENQARGLAAKSRQITTALLERSQDPTAHETITHLRHSALRR
jgi:hypothetical protein